MENLFYQKTYYERAQNPYLNKEFFELKGDCNGFESKKSELKSIFNEAIETIDDDKRLKVNMDNHQVLEDIFNGTFTII